MKAAILIYLTFLLCCCVVTAGAQHPVTADSVQTVIEEASEVEVEVKADTLTMLDSSAFASAESKKINQKQLKELQQDDDFWYVNAVHEKEKVRDWDGSALRQGLKLLVWVLGGALVLFILYQLIQSDVFRAGKTAAVVNYEQELEAAHFADADFNAQLQAALADGDLRAATRIYFLQLLQVLHRKAVIQYQPDALNSHYRQQWRNNSLAVPLNQLTSIYEYSWFGHHYPGAEQFAQWQQLFINTTQKLQS